MNFRNAIDTIESMRSVDELVSIALAGGGLVLDASDFSVEGLSKIALAAGGGNHQAQLRITNTGHLSTEDLIRIGLAGRGAVLFEDPQN